MTHVLYKVGDNYYATYPEAINNCDNKYLIKTLYIENHFDEPLDNEYTVEDLLEMYNANLNMKRV